MSGFMPTLIEGVWHIEPEVRTDERGSFHRVWDVKELQRIGYNEPFVQHNHSVNVQQGTIRGLHYQRSPMMEAKVVKCIRGAIWDVVVDLRKASPTFLKHLGAELNDRDHRLMLIPKGCAHGFQTLEDNTEVLYYHTAPYSAAHEAGLRFDDPMLGIIWPLLVTAISDRDKAFPLLDIDFAGLEV
jgi:dTDP-4-dehydrorhamnose 3,5-epimerase